jgi:hypothetical protein
MLPFEGVAHVGCLPGTASSGTPRWHGSWSCSPATSRSSNASPSRSRS